MVREKVARSFPGHYSGSVLNQEQTVKRLWLMDAYPVSTYESSPWGFKNHYEILMKSKEIVLRSNIYGTCHGLFVSRVPERIIHSINGNEKQEILRIWTNGVSNSKAVILASRNLLIYLFPLHMKEENVHFEANSTQSSVVFFLFDDVLAKLKKKQTLNSMELILLTNCNCFQGFYIFSLKRCKFNLVLGS
ncbi:hypothetical protein Leryth_026752 [Lithospermum erythrorhizon]|nr:hypothetical protein Leryth_026752 [Lithospermum erythrorhizon]